MGLLSKLRKIDHRVFFPFLSESISQKYYVQKEYGAYQYAEDSLDESPPSIRAYFKHCARVWQRKKFHYLYTEGCIVEPSLGWGITKSEQLIPQSLWNNYIDGVKPSYLKYKLLPKKKIHLRDAISLHYAWTNYWHFYNDILGQLRLADEAGVSVDTPVIIPAGLAQRNYFKEIVALSPDLQKRKWIYQDFKTDIYCENTHFFNTFWSHRDNFDAVLEYIEFEKNMKLASARNDRIFIGRNVGRGRNVLNTNEVFEILKKYSFEVIDCDDLSVREQIDVFQNAEYVIGIHGAGLTNIIYRQDKKMSLLEIFSADYLNPTYFWLCQQYGYEYFSMVGDGIPDFSSTVNNFTIDIDEFEIKVRAMIGL